MDSHTTAEAGDRPSRPRKRNRATLSCSHCRIRKLKCSRTQPCDSCLRTGDAATCVYEVASGPRAGRDALDHTTKREMAARIDRLEAMLFTAMSNGTPGVTRSTNGGETRRDEPTSGRLSQPFGRQESRVEPSDSELEQVVSVFGAMKVDQSENRTVYLDGSHWVSILTEIDELRMHLLDNHEDWERNSMAYRQSITPTFSLLRGTAPPITQEELLSYLPEKAVVDRLLDRYFEVYKLKLPIVHEQAFRSEYIYHWQDPARTKLIWLGLLFAMLYLAEISYGGQNKDDPSLDIFAYQPNDEYRKCIIRCLISSNYTNPTFYTVETIVLYVTAEWITNPNASMETYVILGIAVRLAMRMGIHRDSKWQPQITPWQGEMRRRIWAILRSTDIGYSFHLSIPANARSFDCDCALPRNLYNAEFGRDTVELPPSRPPSEETEISYIIFKAKLELIFSDIVDLANSSCALSENDVRRQEDALSEVLQTIPPHLSFASYEESNPKFIKYKELQRELDRLYRLNQCVLYRRYLYRAYQDPTFMRYREPCVTAALRLLSHQSTLFLEINPKYRRLNRREMAALTAPDFCLAGMIIALDLYYEVRSQHFTKDTEICHASDNYEQRHGRAGALEASLNIWRVVKDMSIEASKAHGMFSFILSKYKEAKSRTGITATTGIGTPFLENQDINVIQPIDFAEIDPGLWNLSADAVDYETLFQWPSNLDEILP